MKFPYSVFNHNSLFSHFTNLFILESTEILKLCVAKIITTLWHSFAVSADLLGFVVNILNPSTSIKCVWYSGGLS